MQDFGITDECDYNYTSVHFSGRMHLIDDLAEKQHAVEVLVRQVSINPRQGLLRLSLKSLRRQLWAE